MAEADTGQSSSQGASQSQSTGTSAPATTSASTQTSTQQTGAATGSQQTATTETKTAPQRAEWQPEKYWDGTKSEFNGTQFRKDFDELAAFKAADDSRRLTLPQSDDAYKLDLPASFKPPEGVEFKIDPNNPLWAQGRAWARKHGLSQEAFSEAIALVAGDRIGTEATIKKAFDGEIAKLGTAGPQRVDAVTQWITAMGGDKHGAALAKVLKMAPVASTIEAFETLMQKFQSQGAGSFTATGRQPDQNQRVSDADYEKMTYTERKEYAARFQQVNGAAAA